MRRAAIILPIALLATGAAAQPEAQERLIDAKREAGEAAERAAQVVAELGWEQPWFLVSALGREGTWPIMLEVMAFLDRQKAARAEAEAEADAQARG